MTDTQSPLPMAFYYCLFLGGHIFEGWTHENGTIECSDCTSMGAALSHEHTVFCFVSEDAVSAACDRSTRYTASFRQPPGPGV